jgi:hypothetical protein
MQTHEGLTLAASKAIGIAGPVNYNKCGKCGKNYSGSAKVCTCK